MSKAVVTGQPFMGEMTTQGPVVYLSEQSEATFRVAMERAGLVGEKDFHLLTHAKALGRAWPDLISEVTKLCLAKGAQLLVVDTISPFANLMGDQENNAGDALAAMAPLQRAAAAGLAVLVVRHERKSGGEPGQSGRGSSAFSGAVDTVVTLTRPEGQGAANVREIRCMSRLDGPPDNLMIELTSDGYVARGTAPDVAFQKAKNSILAVAGGNAECGMTLVQLRDATGVSRATVQRTVNCLLAEGKVIQVGGGKRGSPLRYYSPQLLSAQTPTLGGQKEFPMGETFDDRETRLTEVLADGSGTSSGAL